LRPLSRPGARLNPSRPLAARSTAAQARSRNDESHEGASECFTSRMAQVSPEMGPKARHLLLPGEYRLLQVGHPGISSAQHFAKLIDQRRGRRVDEPARVTKPDHAPIAFGNRGEVKGLGLLDLF